MLSTLHKICVILSKCTPQAYIPQALRSYIGAFSLVLRYHFRENDVFKKKKFRDVCLRSINPVQALEGAVYHLMIYSAFVNNQLP